MSLYNDLTLNNGTYINQYSGIPLEQIQHTADVLSTRHYTNLAQASQLDILANQMKSNLLEGAKPEADRHIQAIDTALQDMAKNGGENSTARITALANALQSDQGLLTALQQSKRVKDELDAENALVASGKQPVRKQGIREAMMSAPLRDPVTGEFHDLYKTPYQSTVQPYEDPVPHMESIWKTINPDSIESAIKSAKGTEISKLLPAAYVNGQLDLPLFFESITRAGIGKDKIDKLLGSAWSSYKETPAYKQQKEILGKNDSDLKKEFYNHGLLRTFQNISRDYKATPAWAEPSTTPLVTNEIKSPLPAKTREAIESKLPWSVDNINSKGEVELNLLNKAAISNDNKNKNEAISVLLRSASTLPEGADKDKILSEVSKLKSEIKSTAVPDEQRTKDMLSYMKTAMDVHGINSDIPESELKKYASTPEGKKVLQSYLDNYAGLRYHAPYINNIVDAKTRQANEDFARGNLSQRQFIDMSNGKHYTGLKDENGDVQKDLLPLSKAITESKAIIEGTVDPKHIFTKIDNAGENFTRAIRVQVPGENGEMKEYLVSQLPETTSPIDINENVLYNAATEVPGRWSNIGHNMQVISPASQQQKDKLWQDYGMESGITKEQFDANDIVILEDNGAPKIFPNYTKAAQWVAQNKRIKLQHTK